MGNKNHKKRTISYFTVSPAESEEWATQVTSSLKGAYTEREHHFFRLGLLAGLKEGGDNANAIFAIMDNALNQL